MRHQRSCHKCSAGVFLWRSCAQRLAASTKLSPRGPRGERRCPRASAQRLAASTKLSLDYCKPQRPALLKCSTPCGINEVVTLTGVARVGQGDLCSTPCGINEVVTVPRGKYRSSSRKGAQRLAASTKLSLAGCPCYSTCARRGAQRLAASTKLSPPMSHFVAQATSCAQRLAASTKLSRAGWLVLSFGLSVVLNALRHQRSCHIYDDSGSTHHTQCSTPCGINEVVTSVRETRIPTNGKVLNALRHQRSCHELPS